MNFVPGSCEYDATIGATSSPLVDLWPRVRPDEGATKSDGRIDYGWATPDLADRLSAAWVDAAADGSDHQPLRFEFELGDVGSSERSGPSAWNRRGWRATPDEQALDDVRACPASCVDGA